MAVADRTDEEVAIASVMSVPVVETKEARVIRLPDADASPARGYPSKTHEGSVSSQSPS